MSTVKAPAWLHDVFGESPYVWEVVVTLAFGCAFGAWFVVRMFSQAESTPLWRIALAGLLAVDVAAGCVANFTRSTNDFYARRARNRWVFIALHVHVLVAAWAVGADLSAAMIVWGITAVAASIVNAAAGSEAQPFIAGFFLGVFMCMLPGLGGPAPLMAFHALFFLKVAYAFAVDHHPGENGALVGTARHGLVVLTHRDRKSVVELIAAAFADDPLILSLARASRSAAGPRSVAAAIALYVLDLVLLHGGYARGLYIEGKLVGASLTEAPAGRGTDIMKALIGALQFLPAALRIGASATRLLNHHHMRVRSAAPRDPHYYLAMIAVAPTEQGKGYGKRLLEDVIERADADPRAGVIALDTENEENRCFYEAAGFRLTDRIAVESATADSADHEGVSAFLMVRRNPLEIP